MKYEFVSCDISVLLPPFHSYFLINPTLLIILKIILKFLLWKISSIMLNYHIKIPYTVHPI